MSGLFSPKVKNKVYARPWGKHKNGYFRLVYSTGAYAQIDKMKDGKVVSSRIVEIECKRLGSANAYAHYDIDGYAQTHGFQLLRD